MTAWCLRRMRSKSSGMKAFSPSFPYSPVHSKQCVIDRQIILDGSFNWYNTSVVSHDMLIVLNHYDIAQLYLQEADQILSTFRTLWLTDAR